MATLLLYGDTVRTPALRHEVPIEIIDPFLFADAGGRRLVLTNPLERNRIAEALPDAELLLVDELGLVELIEGGMELAAAELEVVLRAVRRWGVTSAVVSPDLGVAVADALRAAGVELVVDRKAVDARRRSKSPAELGGIRRAQRAAEAGMAAGERLIR